MSSESRAADLSHPSPRSLDRTSRSGAPRKPPWRDSGARSVPGNRAHGHDGDGRAACEALRVRMMEDTLGGMICLCEERLTLALRTRPKEACAVECHRLPASSGSRPRRRRASRLSSEPKADRDRHVLDRLLGLDAVEPCLDKPRLPVIERELDAEAGIPAKLGRRA